MRYTDVLNLLGEPDDTDSMYIVYKIELEYGNDIDPVFKKDLLLYMDNDSIVIACKTEEQDLPPNR